MQYRMYVYMCFSAFVNSGSAGFRAIQPHCPQPKDTVGWNETAGRGVPSFLAFSTVHWSRAEVILRLNHPEAPQRPVRQDWMSANATICWSVTHAAPPAWRVPQTKIAMVVFQGEWRDIGGNKKIIEKEKAVKLGILNTGMWGYPYVQSTFFTTQNMDGARLELLRLSSSSLFFRSSDHAMSSQHVLHWQPSTMRSQGQTDKHCKDVAFDGLFLLDAPFSANG